MLSAELGDLPEIPDESTHERSAASMPRENTRLFFKVAAIASVVALMGGAAFWTWQQGWWLSASVPVTQFNGLSQSNGMPLKGKIKWTYKTGGRIASRPAFAHDSIFVGSEDHHIYAVTTAGATKWKYRTQGLISSSPYVNRDSLYIGSADHALYALNAQNGELRWRFETKDVIYSSPIVVQEQVYFGSNDGHLYAVAEKTGQLTWKQSLGGTIFSAPIYDAAQDVLYVASTNGVLYQIDRKTGKMTWKFVTDEGEPIYATPALAGPLVVFNCMDRYLYGVNPTTHKLPIKLNQGTSVSSPYFDAQYLYYGTYSGDVYARDPKQNGKAVWVKPLGEEIVSSPTVVDNTVFVASLKGHLFALDAPSGAQRWKLSLAAGDGISSSPLLVNDTLYIGGLDGKLYAIE